LLLSLEEWDSGVAPLLGPAEFRDGAEVPVYPALESATSGLTLAASWQQEWEFQQGILQEQIFLLDSAESAEKFVRQWSQYFSAAGLVSESSTVNGRAIVEVSYTDPAAQGFFANRRCAAQAVSQADSAVIVTTLFQGGDCTVLPKRVAAGVSAGLAEKVASVID
jgi:hypothetical protein